jgi:mono/diheme cytochrome c family protein
VLRMDLFRVAMCFLMAGSTAATAALDPAKASFLKDILPLLEDHCYACHGDGQTKGGLALDEFQTEKDVHHGYKIWEQIRKLVAAGEMPPEGRKNRPDGKERDLLAGWARHSLDNFYRTAPPDPGRVTVRRLNRNEYNNVVRDLLFVDFQPANDFPADDTGYGFDNIGDVLSTSPLLMEKYLDAAEAIASAAVMIPKKNGEVTAFQKEYFTLPLTKEAEETVFKGFVTTFMRRAYRREVRTDEVDRMMAVSKAVVDKGAPFDARVQVVIQGVLVSPHFLFRWELDGAPSDPKAIRRLNEYELASRLAFFIWSSGPDDRLLDLAAKGVLRKQLKAEVHRMLADPKAEALVRNFSGQWLQLRNLDIVRPDKSLFPTYTHKLRDDMRRETELLFADVLRGNRPLTELLTARYSFVNGRLAALYGLSNVRGDEFRKVALKGNTRAGVLGHASVLTLTSDPNRTSPVKRGKYVLDNILGTPPPPPPPNVPELEEAGEIKGTVREQMAKHSTNAVCASCHKKMDPIGFAFENFDAIGRYRTEDNGAPVDAGGQLDSGESFKNAAELRAIFATKKSDLFIRCVTEKMLIYALGRGLEYYDKRPVDKIIERLDGNDDRSFHLVMGIVESLPFDMKRGEAAP